MQHGKGKFETAEGLILFEQWWRPDTEPKAVVVIVHGFTEHSSRYAHVAEYLTQNNYAVYAFDLRGHGKSKGTRAYVRSFDEYVADLKCFLGRVKKYEPEKDVFLLGHSIGAAICALSAITRQVDVRGLILSGPFIKVPANISPITVTINQIVSRIFPKLPIVKRPDDKFISSDPEVVVRYKNDPLVYHGGVFSKQAAEIKRAMDLIQAGMESISLPLLILHGTTDSFADVEGSKQLYARAKSSDKTLKLYEGFYHEVFNEPGKERVLGDVVAWLNAHT